MSTILLTFANSRETPLKTLAEEYAALNKRLSSRVLRQHFLSWAISHAGLDDIAYYLTLFRDQIALFLYSGHAGRDALLTEDNPSRAEGIAHLLGQCANLKVVILNGCSTEGQVKALHKAGIPLVIATTAPVNDESATRFSIRLFQALESGLNIGEAFEQAIGEALARTELKVLRGSLDLNGDAGIQLPVWGIFQNPDAPDARGWKLPVKAAALSKNYALENENLLEALYGAFSQTNTRVRELFESGAELSERQEDIVSALLRSLPAPISEQVRKLVAPSTPGGIDGWDVVGAARLSQLAQTYEICMDFLVYVLLSHLWECAQHRGAQFMLLPGQREILRLFFDFNDRERRECDYFSLLSLLSKILVDNGDTPFVVELNDLKKRFFDDDPSKNACFFLENLRRAGATADLMETGELCGRAEEALCVLFQRLDFLGRYTLATVRNIDVQKYRHTPEAQFEHLVVKWHGTLGFYDKELRRQANFMDNRSVVLLGHQHTGLPQFLNLSPFIIDENTFETTPDMSLSKLYFLAWRDVHTNSLYYKFVNDPENEIICLDDAVFYDRRRKASKFQLAIEQFSVFYATIFNVQALEAV